MVAQVVQLNADQQKAVSWDIRSREYDRNGHNGTQVMCTCAQSSRAAQGHQRHTPGRGRRRGPKRARILPPTQRSSKHPAVQEILASHGRRAEMDIKQSHQGMSAITTTRNYSRNGHKEKSYQDLKDLNPSCGHKGSEEDAKSQGRRSKLSLAYVLFAAIAVLANADLQGTQMGTTHGQQAQDFTRLQTDRRTSAYKQFMADNNFIKSHKVVQAHSQGKQRAMEVITVNITSLSDGAREWLAAQTADIILVQEHRCLYRKEFGRIPGFETVFSPARRTMLSGRGWETSGGGWRSCTGQMDFIWLRTMELKRKDIIG